MPRVHQPRAYEKVVRDALSALVCSTPVSGASPSIVQSMELERSDGQTLRFPVDQDLPADDTLAAYLCKQVEYVEAFFVSERLAKDMDQESIIPLNADLTPIVDSILCEVGRRFGSGSRDEDLRYYPAPYLQQVIPGIPFLDFAGFMSVTLMDFLRWMPDRNNPTYIAARAEVETAVGLILNPSTYIPDHDGIGWAFIPADKCAPRPALPVVHQRHIFPTAWCVTAIYNYGKLPDPSRELMQQIRELLPKVFSWTKTLIREKGLYASMQSRGERLGLAGHNYVTECLLTLTELLSDTDSPIALAAIERFDEELRREGARDSFEANIAIPVSLKDFAQPIYYPDRTTWANCLSTLAFAHYRVVGCGVEDLRQRVRMQCDDMAKHIVFERRNAAGLWQEGNFSFNWTYNAVEALMRHGRFAQPALMVTSDDAISAAIDAVLRNPRIRQEMQEAMVRAVKTASANLPQNLTSDNSTE